MKNSKEKIKTSREKVLRLREKMKKVMTAYPEADPENVWHALILLEKKPIDRLRKALLRGQKINLLKKGN